MIALPDATPVTTPLVAFTDATEGLLLLQVPPLFPSLVKGADNPAQIVAVPLIVPETGSGFIVTVLEADELEQAEVTV